MKLFIHGAPNTGAMWAPLIDALGLEAGTFACPSLPGFDGNLPAGFSADPNAYTLWLLRRLQRAALRHGPVDLVGHDWGAVFAGLAAAARPDLVRSLAMINAVPASGFRWYRTARILQTPALGGLAMAMTGPNKIHKLLRKGGLPEPIASEEAARCDRAMRKAMLSLYRSAGLNRPRGATLAMDAISTRSLVLWGADDGIVPLSGAEAFCARWRIPLVAVPGVGHWGLLERPDAFAAQLSGHWTAIGSGTMPGTPGGFEKN